MKEVEEQLLEEKLPPNAVDPNDETLQAEEKEILEKAVDFAYGFSRQGSECPFCSKQFYFREDQKKPNPIAMQKHLGKVHSFRCIAAWQANDITVSIRTPEPTVDQLVGLQMQDEFDRYDMLYIDPALKQEAEASGDQLRWTSPENMARRKAMGASLVTVGNGADPVTATTAADGAATAREMRLMRIPAAVVKKHLQRREMRANRMATSKEELNVAADAVEQGIYDSMLKQGKDSTVARQVSRALAGRLRRQAEDGGEDPGNWRSGSPNARRNVRTWRGELK